MHIRVIRVIAYVRTRDGQSWEKEVQLPFPPFLGLHLHLTAGDSIMGFRVVNVEYHEEMSLEEGDCVVLFLHCVDPFGFVEDDEFGEGWVKNGSVVWPTPEVK